MHIIFNLQQLSLHPLVFPSPKEVSEFALKFKTVQDGEIAIKQTKSEAANPRCLDSKAIAQFPVALKNFINLTKIIWTVACTVARFVMVIGFLPIAYPIRLITRSPDPSVAPEADATSAVALNTLDQIESLEPSSEAKISTSKEKKPWWKMQILFPMLGAEDSLLALF